MNEADNKEKAAAGGKRGEMIVVCSAKGGIGRTVLAVNLAVALTKKNIQIGLLDASFQFGDVALALDLHPTFTVKDAVESLAHMDRHTLAGYLIHHHSGVKVLAAPERPEQADLVTAEAVEQICDLLLAHHDYVIVDTGAGLQEKTLQLLEKADHVFMMTTLEMTAVKNTKLMLETLEVLGLREKTQLIVNRATMESVLKASDVPDMLGMEGAIFVPNDFQLVSQSLNIGIPFVLNQAKSEMAKTVFKMAEQLISRREISTFKPKAGSFFQQLFGRAAKA
ncbi:pilus assembly protein CpaE [Paenibacillus phyllosphaerae]|uniref:Pilus assembly protein CpaE n=1 Tax=Paenibacillus phyllosphaerae TaxID=274593 RepID=A0A7W5B531_9BACL|nr:P-loop NTPase [Paenibacillus phyllosphaerae]MBB3113826.1 pilus assembly protein CpaE [Paenibacillus phyllosphaerae]